MYREVHRNRVGARAAAVALCLFWAAAATPAPGPSGAPASCALHPPGAPAARASHPFRLSVADGEIDGGTLRFRIRFFWDDLQFALMESTGDMEFRLRQDAQVDAVVEAYVNDMLTIEAGGRTVRGEVVERGIQEARRPDEVMWWYALEYPLDPAAERIRIRNRLLMNMFEDQRNLVNLTTRGGRERTRIFGFDEDEADIRIGPSDAPCSS